MTILGTSAADRATLARRLAEPSHVVVVALCAAWCTTCREFRAAFGDVARARTSISLVWIDVEDDADLLGDLDIETFPTLAIYEGSALRHYGVVLPQAALIERLIDAAAGASVDAPDAVVSLIDALGRAR